MMSPGKDEQNLGILRWNIGNIEIIPGSPVERVRELFDHVDKSLDDTSLMKEYTSLKLYCLWHDAKKYIETYQNG